MYNSGMYNCSYVCFVAVYNVYNFCIHSYIYIYIFIKPVFNAPPLIHQVALFDYHSDAFQCFLAPSLGSAVYLLNFSTHQMAINNCPTTYCRTGLQIHYFQFTYVPTVDLLVVPFINHLRDIPV
jgi:hypothetical protein